jgi:hypothetical protein
MPPVGDKNVPHEAGVDKAIDAQMRRTSTQAHIPNATAAATSPPTKTEYDALVAKFNLVLGVLRDAELLPTS